MRTITIHEFVYFCLYVSAKFALVKVVFIVNLCKVLFYQQHYISCTADIRSI